MRVFPRRTSYNPFFVIDSFKCDGISSQAMESSECFAVIDQSSHKTSDPSLALLSIHLEPS